MEDLLREDEFVPKNNHYNPWKVFAVFYGIAIVQILAMQAVISFWLTDYSSVFVGIIYLLLPLLMAVLMFTYNAKSFSVPRKVKIMSILGLVFCFAVVNLVINLIKVTYIRTSFVWDDVTIQLITTAGYFVVISVICCGLVYIVSGLVKRRAKKAEFTLQ